MANGHIVGQKCAHLPVVQIDDLFSAQNAKIREDRLKTTLSKRTIHVNGISISLITFQRVMSEIEIPFT